MKDSAAASLITSNKALQIEEIMDRLFQKYLICLATSLAQALLEAKALTPFPEALYCVLKKVSQIQ